MFQANFLSRGFTPPTWHFPNFTVRPLRSNDHEAWSEYLTDPQVTQHTSWGRTDSQTISTVVDKCISGYANGTSCRWALADANDTLIGTCAISNWSLEHVHAELAYDLSPHYWRRGVMLRAVTTVLEWAFHTVGFNRIHALVMDSNVASQALLKRLGFVREGLLKQYRFAHGEHRDFYMYALLRKECVAPK